MPDSLPHSIRLRPVTGDEFETWARVIADTYGEERSPAGAAFPAF
ncbi:hypothetical protein ABT354_33790 [Streptomyces sp. NPDC000594]